MGIMRIWIARDKDNELNMFNTEPIREIDFFMLPQREESEPWMSFWPLPNDELPEITWENSPVMCYANIVYGKYAKQTDFMPKNDPDAISFKPSEKEIAFTIKVEYTKKIH